jgi:recombination associated protein RdgC
MWIRNLCVFLSKQRLTWSLGELEERLAGALCPECGGTSPAVAGFVPPVKGEHAMVYGSDGLAVCIHQEITRLLPTSVLAEEVAERIERIETMEARQVGKRERADIRDQAHFELLPQAFTRAKHTPVILDLRNSRIWVDCAAEKRAEQIIASLRTALGSLLVTRATPAMPPAEEMSRWLDTPTRLPKGFECGDRCMLEANDDAKTSVRITAMDLARDEVRAHLAAGLQAVRLNLSVDDTLEFDLDANLDLKRIRALDLLQEDIDGLEAEDAVAELHARVALQGQALRGVLDRLYAHFSVADESQIQAA